MTVASISTTTQRTAKPRTGLRWAIYCRVSTKQQSIDIGGDPTDKVSLSDQQSTCRDLIARLDPTGTIDARHVFKEVHTGIDLSSRREMSRLREMIRNREVDAIACYHPYRWTRHHHHYGYLRTELDEAGVFVRFALDDPGEGAGADLVGMIQAWSGNQDHHRISENTHNARRALVRRGSAWAGCKAPYGLRWRYRADQRSSGRVDQVRIGWDVEPTEAAVVASLFADLLAGKTLRGMARELTERGVRSPKGRAGWTHGVVKDLLESVIYTGEAYGLRYQRDKSDQYIGQRGASAGQPKYRDKILPSDEWVRLPDGYAPQIVDRDTFDAAQRALASIQRGGRQPIDPSVSLMRGGRARCASCGRALVIHTRERTVRPDRPGKPGPKPNPGAGRRIGLICHGRKAWDRCLAPAWIGAQMLDDAVKRLARHIYEHPEVIAEQAELHRQNDPTEADLVIVKQTLADVEQQQQSLAMVAGRITSPEAIAPLAHRLEQLADQQRKAQQDRADLLKRRAGWEASQRFLEGFASSAHRVRERLDSFGHAEWQEAIDALQIGAVVQPSTTDGDRYRLTIHLAGIVTAELLAKLDEELKYRCLAGVSA